MREDREAAFAALAETRPPTVPTATEGRVLFKSYCARCHGDKGYGDGRMAAVYKDPGPFPLVYSAMPGAYLTHIITGGGASVGRSEVMPSFAEQLSEAQIQSVILHLYSIRLLDTQKFQ
jgi:mono/diheme cytochrome c family protein